ncbi:MAG: ribosome biogenesis GTPase Der, partial [Nitrospirales bacterium]|nr:ribosome biogenesis GTPase Der [Nitrospirales bacterium]
LKRLFPKIDEVMGEFSKRIPTGRLNQFLQQAVEKNPLPYRRGQPTKSVFMTQVSTKPPTFVLFVRNPKDVSSTYLRYLENSLRQSYGFVGAPIRILVRSK